MPYGQPDQSCVCTSAMSQSCPLLHNSLHNCTSSTSLSLQPRHCSATCATCAGSHRGSLTSVDIIYIINWCAWYMQVLSLQSSLSCASLYALLILHVWQSYTTTPLKLDLGRPGGRRPLTSPNKSFLGNVSLGILKIWPSHLSLLLCSWDSTEKVLHLFSMSTFGTWSHKDMPHMHRKQFI